jgi:hypothetical protein
MIALQKVAFYCFCKKLIMFINLVINHGISPLTIMRNHKLLNLYTQSGR